MAEGKSVLIIEDDRVTSDLYKRELEISGFRVLQAFDGEEGVAMMSTHLPDLILLDLRMPKMGGLSTLEEIKKDKRTEKIPVVVLTNFGSDKNIKAAFDLGASDFIIKYRFTPKEVVEKVKKTLLP